MFVITADQVGSRTDIDRSAAMQSALQGRFGRRLRLPVDQTAGDELQALTDDPGTGRIETARGGAKAGSVSREDVGLVVTEALDRPGLRGQVVEFNTGDVPVADALTAHEC